MFKQSRVAYDQIQKLGAKLIDGSGWNAEFIMSGEDRDVDGNLFGDYYQEEIRERWNDDKTKILNVGGIRTEINDILAAQDLYAEWIDGGTIGVYKR
jgi:hypothetical protein